MADPTETSLSTAEASALEGTSDGDIDLTYPESGVDYTTTGIELWSRAFRMLRAVKGLRVVKDGDITYGVYSGSYMDGGTIRTYAGSSSNALTDDDTNYIYLTPAGVLTCNVTGWPSTEYLPLATIAAGSESAAAASGEYNEEDVVDYRERALFRTIGGAGVKKLVSQTLAFGSFTDNGDTTGYIDFTSGTIPAGSIVIGWKAVVATAFQGDSTATIMVGVDGDTDAFSADTAQSVFAAATVGSASLAAESFCGSATTPRVTVTEDSDFGDITQGSMVVTVYYIDLP